MPTPSSTLTMKHAVELDAKDPLHSFRQEFYIPEGVIYMDGNSLGLASRAAEKAVLRALEEWKLLGIRGWLEAESPWFELGETLGGQFASLVGAEPNEVVVTGATTVNLHQLVATFYEPTATRTRVLADELNFPSDLYALESQLRMRGCGPLLLVESSDGRTLNEADIEEAFTESTALAVLPSVLYRSGQLLNMARLTRAAHEQGVLIGFDCSHSVGVIPHKFDEWDVDFAFWCNYKYVNGGPGATAGLYVNRRHFDRMPGLAGWWGNEKKTQFDLRVTYEPAASAGALQIGTPSILGTAALQGALEVIHRAGIDRLREKSLALTRYLMELIDERLVSLGFRVGTPREDTRRGGHVALEHPDLAVQVSRALKRRGIIPDFRPPNTFCDVWQVVEAVYDIVETGEYEAFSDKRDPVA